MKTSSEIIEEIVANAKGMTRPVFRGQSNAEWQLQSGAVYRLEEAIECDSVDNKNNVRRKVHRYHMDNLIYPMQIIDGRNEEEMSYFERLSVLQHHGAATGFIDFTESLLVALWFACESLSCHDGKVFMLDIGNIQVAKNGRGRYEEDIFSTEEVIYYEPNQSLARIMAQQSILLIIPPKIPDSHLLSIRVRKEAKSFLIQHLEACGISERKLFPDIQGLAHRNARNISLRPNLEEELTPNQYRDKGNQDYQAERYEKALVHYRSYAAACLDLIQPHCLIGDTLSALGDFPKAVDAYTRAIDMEREGRPINLESMENLDNEAVRQLMLHLIYYNRGNAYAALEEHNEAISDYDKSLKHGDWQSRNVLYNRGNSKFALKHYEEAFNDFEAVWSERIGSDAALAMGNCKVIMREFEDGLQQYLEGVRCGEPQTAASHCQKHVNHLYHLLSLSESCFYEIKQGDSVYVEGAHISKYFDFVGNSGNVGNTPSSMTNMPGGEGYKGLLGFVIIARPNQN